MDLIYKKIWNLAKPYYKKGRPMDIAHIEWMIEEVEKICDIENIDKSILMPLAILHDVGYSELKNLIDTNYYNKDIRKAHMQAGALIANKILMDVSYPKEKIKKIVDLVSIHDNWAFGIIDIYINDKLLGTFKDLDYLWTYTKVGFASIRKNLKKNKQEMLTSLQEESTPIYNKKPFSTEYTKQLREKYLNERKN